jgi:hypothetical protein
MTHTLVRHTRLAFHSLQRGSHVRCLAALPAPSLSQHIKGSPYSVWWWSASWATTGTHAWPISQTQSTHFAFNPTAKLVSMNGHIGQLLGPFRLELMQGTARTFSQQPWVVGLDRHKSFLVAVVVHTRVPSSSSSMVCCGGRPTSQA